MRRLVKRKRGEDDVDMAFWEIWQEVLKILKVLKIVSGEPCWAIWWLVVLSQLYSYVIMPSYKSWKQPISDSVFSLSAFDSPIKLQSPHFPCVRICVYRAFRKHSYPLNYSTFCCVTAWIQNGLNIYIFSPIYTQYPIMTKWKQVFRNLCKYNEKQKYLIYTSIHTPESKLCRSTFAGDYSCESFWVRL